MNRDSYYKHFGVKSPQFRAMVSDVTSVESSSSDKSLLDTIYGLDPVTRLPSGEIALYLSPNTAPEVKQYILNNLMQDTSAVALPPLPDGIDADTAFAIERKQGESLDNWRTRVQGYMQEQIDFINQSNRLVVNGEKSDT